MTKRWHGVLRSALIGLAGVPAIADEPSAPPFESPATCPPVVQEFLEVVGLLPEVPEHAQPIVLIDVQGQLLGCLPQTLASPLHAQAAAFLHQGGIVMAQHQEAGPVCRIGKVRLGTTSFMGLIVSYDPALMRNQACLQQARQDLEELKGR